MPGRVSSITRTAAFSFGCCMSAPVSIAQDQAKFRSLTLYLCAFLTLVWAALAAAGLIEVLPGHQGYGALAAVLVTIVYVIFVLPALLLAWFNRLVGVAFTLAVLGLVCYAYDPILRLTAYLGN
jgi:hypothetical protein